MTQTKFCYACGQQIDVRAEICPKCGVRQQDVRTTGQKSKVVAGIFALLLGFFGAHKFYLGKVGQGLLYLIFCWTFIPALIAFFEGIIYLCMSDEDFAKKYG